MKQELGGEAEAFLASYHAPRQQALRLNPAKYGWSRATSDTAAADEAGTAAAEGAGTAEAEGAGTAAAEGTGTASSAETAAAALVAEVLETAPEQLEPVLWASHAYYYAEEQRPGKNPLHDAGLYYIQEPSAMATVGELEQYLKETGRTGPFRALDLCAAPGGKSTQLLTMLREMDVRRAEQAAQRTEQSSQRAEPVAQPGRQAEQCAEPVTQPDRQAEQEVLNRTSNSTLVSNEIIPSRAAILSENMERFGAVGAIVTNESPEKLAARFPSYFDLMVVDAPCSGEGMFRKEETAVREWSPENVAMCAQRQRQILEQAAMMLADSGVLAYSTCTFSREENEDNAAWLAETHPELKLVLERRLYPHQVRGEGHFVALFQKAGVPAKLSDTAGDRIDTVGNTGLTGSVGKSDRFGKYNKHGKTGRPGKGGKAGKAGNNSKLTEPVNAWNAFAKENLRLKIGPEVDLDLSERAHDSLQPAVSSPRQTTQFSAILRDLTPDRVVLFGEELSLLPDGLSAAQLTGLKVLRPGLHLGTVRKNRFEPSHALALALTSDEVIHSFELSTEQALRYLRGETLPLEFVNETASAGMREAAAPANKSACKNDMASTGESGAPAPLKGWVLVTYRGVSLGWGKAAGGILKNHYPKGLRRLS